VEPDCSAWVGLIERGEIDKIDLDGLRQILRANNCDVLVLGCTHFHSLKSRLQEILPEMTILEPSDAIVARVRSLL
jgi:glutamate racemase